MKIVLNYSIIYNSVHHCYRSNRSKDNVLVTLLFSTEEISWYEMCDTSPTGLEQTSYYFKDLANAIQILHCKTEEWSEDDIISVMDELSCEYYYVHLCKW